MPIRPSARSATPIGFGNNERSNLYEAGDHTPICDAFSFLLPPLLDWVQRLGSEFRITTGIPHRLS